MTQTAKPAPYDQDYQNIGLRRGQGIDIKQGDMVNFAFDAVLVVPGGSGGEAVLAGNLGGMPAITRQLRLLARSGARRLVVVHRPADREALGPALASRWCPQNVEISLHSQQHPNEALPGDLAQTLLILPAHHVLDHKCFAAPRTYLSPDDATLIWFGPKDQAQPAIQALLEDETPHWPSTGAIPLPEGWLASRADLGTIQRLLWNSCRKPIDGIISRYVNRPLSLAISRTIVSLPVTPNQITLFSAAIGLAGAACVMAGGYAMALLGAVLLQIASILDGVDGELARVRVQFSVLGEWFDTVADDVVNIAFVLAIGIARWRSGMVDEWTALALGTAGVMMLVAIIYYVWIARAGRGDILSVDWFDPSPAANTGLFARLQALGTTLFRRDFMIAMLLLAALFGAVHLALVPIAFGEVIILGAQAVRLVSRTR